MSATSQKLFVYGSLRSGFKNEAYEYLSKYFTHAGEGLVKGKFYFNGKYPVAIATENEDMIVGELYSLNNEEDYSWAFEQLDDYEGINVEVGQKPLYKRTMVHVYQEEKVIPAWIYWFNESVEGYEAIASGDLLNYLQQTNNN